MKCILVVLLLTVSSLNYAQTGFEKAEYQAGDSRILPYRILYPENYNPQKKYPLVLFLHGAGERGNDNEKQLTHGASLFLDNNNRKKFPAIVVFPQCPSDSYWASATIRRDTMPLDINFNYNNPIMWPLEGAVSLVKEFINNGKADERRIYIIGLSMGGMGTFEAIGRNPDLFAAAIPICGGGDRSSCKLYADKLPVWIFHGDQDDVVRVEYSREMYSELRSLGANVTYTEYKGVRHTSWDDAFREPELLKWLFRKKRKNN